MQILTRIVYRSGLGDFLVLRASGKKIHTAAPNHTARAQIHWLAAVKHAWDWQAALVLLAFVAARLRNDCKWQRHKSLKVALESESCCSQPPIKLRNRESRSRKNKKKLRLRSGVKLQSTVLWCVIQSIEERKTQKAQRREWNDFRFCCSDIAIEAFKSRLMKLTRKKFSHWAVAAFFFT